MENEKADAINVFLELVGRKFFDLVRQVGDASLVSKWYVFLEKSLS